MIRISNTLLEKQSKFLRYNMKCRGKPDTTYIHEIFCVVLGFPRYISCYCISRKVDYIDYIWDSAGTPKFHRLGSAI